MKAAVRRRSRTQWTAQFLVAAELARQGYTVSFTMGNNTPTADLMVGTEDGKQFWVDVKGLYSNNAWLISRKEDHINLFYVLVRVGEAREKDRFFVLNQSDMNKLLVKSEAARKPTDTTSGFGFRYPKDFEGNWKAFPPSCPN
jgi:hypothetical protein